MTAGRAAAVLLFAAALSSAGADPIRGEFWLRPDMVEITVPGSSRTDTDVLSERERSEVEDLLEDARWAFSCMIYGFSVTWTPPAVSRSVSEELVIEPLALIPRGDPRMRTVSITRDNGLIYILLEYSPDTTQAARLAGWRGQDRPAASGSALVPVNRGSRREVMEAAVKDALHQWLRVRDYNRPREIRGRAAFLRFPLIGLEGGSLKASVVIGMDLQPVRHYAID